MAVGLVVGCASPPKPAAGVAVASAPAPAEQKICRSEASTGSTLPTRVCRTKAEVEARAKANEANAKAFEDSRESRPPPQ
jgi:hypothetical protein